MFAAGDAGLTGSGEFPEVPAVVVGLLRALVAAGRGEDGELVADPVAAVGFVVGQRLAGPGAGDEDAPAAEAEGVAPVGFALATAGRLPGAGVLRLDAVAQPVRARRGTRFVT